MEIYQQKEAVNVFGHLVKTFPLGIEEAFTELEASIPHENQRAYYGLSKMDANNDVLYWAVAPENYPGEAKKFTAETFNLPAGDYLAVTVHDWHSKTSMLKDVFHELMQDKRADLGTFCIEWYHHANEMMCMIKML